MDADLHLAYRENRRYTCAASCAQVAEKLHDRLMFRHRHHLRHLAPVIPIPRPAIEKPGYSIG